MSTVLGLPLILDDEQAEEMVTMRHDPREPGHPLHVTRGQGPSATTRDYDSVDIHHHQPAGHQPPTEGVFGSYTTPAPQGPAQPVAGPGLGSYYPTQRVRPVSKGAAVAATVNPMAGAALGIGPLQAAGLGIGASALLITAYVGVMGGLGYWVGGKLAPRGESDTTYKWGGAVGNVLLPGVGLGAVALVAMLKD